MSSQQTFTDIYNKNIWRFGSGRGSLISATKPYRIFLEEFVRQHQVQSIVDFGCGDWQFSQLIDWGNAEYLGLDVVGDVIERNKKKFARKNIRFEIAPPRPEDIPTAELLLVKDVLQHWNISEIQNFLHHALPKFQFVLITNCVRPESKMNLEIRTGDFRPLDVRRPPFDIDAQCVLTFEGFGAYSLSTLKYLFLWQKKVLLVTK